MKDLISIIVPVYNAVKYLKRCVNSILNQTYYDIELILVDDGSSDGSEKLCDEYALSDQRVKVIHQENAGMSVARNNAIKVANGKWLLFVDSDDYVSTNLCERVLLTAIENKADLVAFDMEKVEAEEVKECVSANALALDCDIDIISKVTAMELSSNDEFGCYVWNKFYLKKLFDGIEFPKGRMLEDMAIMHLLLDKAERIAYVRETFYYYVQHNNSLMHRANKKRVVDQFEMATHRYNFLKDRYPKAFALMRETYLRYATTYVVTFYAECKVDKVYNESVHDNNVLGGSLFKDGLVNKETFELAEKVMNDIHPKLSEDKLKVIVLWYLHRYFPFVFRALSKKYYESSL